MVKCFVDSTGWVRRPPRKNDVSSRAVTSLGRVVEVVGLEKVSRDGMKDVVGVLEVSCGGDPMIPLSPKSPVEAVVRS